MPISYAGFPLLLDDPDGIVQEWIDRWQPLDDVRPCQETMARRGNLATHTKGQKNGRGLPIPNYPKPPPARLNTLHWPTGAARWATFFALADKETAEACQAAYKAVAATAASGGVEFPKLVLYDGTTTLELEMHLLSPRVVTVAGADQDAKQLYILPFVDERWWWQYRGVGDQTNSGVTFPNIATELAVSIAVDTPVAAYVEPDYLELNRSNENAAVLLDALSHGFGQRFVRRLDGTLHSMNWESSSETLIDENLVDYQLVAGGIASHILPDAADPAPVPEYVRTTFRFWRDGMVIDVDYDHRGSADNVVAPTEYVVDHAATDVFDGVPPQGYIAGVAKTYHSTMYAIIGYSATERAAPTNQTELEDLAEQIAIDYFASLDYQYDMTFAGIKNWNLTGYDDHVEIRMDAASGAVTRVQSSPVNFGSEVNLSQSTTDTFIFGDQIIVYLSGLSRYDGATYLGYDDAAAVWEPIPATAGDVKGLEDTGLAVRVFSCWGNDDQGSVTGFAVAERVHDIWVVTQTDPWATPQEPASP